MDPRATIYETPKFVPMTDEERTEIARHIEDNPILSLASARKAGQLSLNHENYVTQEVK